MSVMCVGGSWVLRQLAEKRHLEAELTRAGFRHEEFTFRIDPIGEARYAMESEPHYQVKVTHSPTQTVKGYRGGATGDWIERFAQDLAAGLYGQPSSSPRPTPLGRPAFMHKGAGQDLPEKGPYRQIDR
ncbi:MAG TPA: hypothetical protein VMM27_07385 [Casimicrobiaceae bacterium]|nr:hypothetical protein [Casimicrobiaceae bacterium]